MGNPYVGEIRMFAGNFAPLGWEFCSGQLLSIAEYDTLFNLIGTTYGGDGQSTFALPNLRGRLPVHFGNGAILGETGGVETVTVTAAQLPIHNHSAGSTNTAGDSASPVGGVPAANTTALAYGSIPPQTNMNSAVLGFVGGNQPHDNLQPFLCVSFIISLFGVFPSPT